MDYYRQCDTCQRTTFSTQAPKGLAKPFPIPHLPLTHICMDFISLPPKVRKEHRQEIIYDHVFTIVDQFSQYVKIIPLTKNPTPDNLITKFFYHVCQDWGMPQDIVSDQDARFTSKARKEF